MIIDLRSDTVTKPSAGMLEAMFKALVGDDVFGEDPTVNRLETMTAEMFGMEAGLFCPSGTMTNQIAIKCQTQPGDEVICDELSHIYQFEGGGIAFNSGCSVKLLQGDKGRINAQQVLTGINPPFDWKANTSFVSLENTTNRGGGTCYNFIDIQQIKEVCLKNNLRLHLDGARLFNALVAKQEKPKQYGEIFDSISICLSKGLGTPVGSVLLGNTAFIKKARRVRKAFGGGMRQAGYLAAAGIFALENNIERLAEDHKHGRQIGEALSKKSFVSNLIEPETNILVFEVLPPYTAVSFIEYLSKYQVLATTISPTQLRMVTHHDITGEMVIKLISIIEKM
ncbi:MAG: GntG family PLP-dependent aldolase [Bacteroidota bacterium]